MFPKLVTLAVIGLMLMVVPPALTLRYTVHNTKVIFFEALHQCIKNGGYLAAVETPYQAEQIWTAIKNSGASTSQVWWVSGTDLGIEGSWLWLSRNKAVGTIRGWTNWMDGEPNNSNNVEHCMSLNGSKNGQWNDISCEATQFYVCEYTY
ncbi:C-type lectin domain family 4 member K-like [Anopheles maculipalpis]|uniref:C-type lectin domain family 4 member K-like n=1 Tax=Anopheles maculipalpis TaxID=1496333 RepID=UPI002158D6B0|nr:C-type lectin domain family 4 member K-like [Anopheles maculipalpis]